jgi:hypothetical protein
MILPGYRKNKYLPLRKCPEDRCRLRAAPWLDEPIITAVDGGAGGGYHAGSVTLLFALTLPVLTDSFPPCRKI